MCPTGPAATRGSLSRLASPPGPDPSSPSSPGTPPFSAGSLHRLPGRDPTRPPDGSEGGGPSVFPATLFYKAHSVLVYGASRPLVRLAVYALASSVNPQLHWVEFGPPPTARTPCDPVRLGWIPNERLWLIDPSEGFRPDDASGNLPISRLISAEEPAESLNHFVEFLRLPDLSQQIIASQAPDGHPGVVAVTNVQHVADAFSSDRVLAILSVHQQSGFSVIVGHDETPGPGCDLFDFVFRLRGDGDRLEDWRRYELVCEKGITSGPLGGRRPVRLDEIPQLDMVLSRARPAES